MHHGATPDEWAHWSDFLGLSEHLLPVVCTPNLPISQGSTLKSYGKVPSVVSKGSVVGLANWTSRVTTDGDLASWGTNPNYGICLQTRVIRAIDVDVEDADEAAAILDELLQFFDARGLPLPVRSRENSSKFLILFELEGEHAKQRLKTEHGIIEFLGNGQQCLVAGSHPSGVRYRWGISTGHGMLLPYDIPRLTYQEFSVLRNTLELSFSSKAWSEPRLRAARGTLESIDSTHLSDPVLPYLRTHSLILAETRDGRMHVACPWASTHTTRSDDSSTTYFPAGTGGYEQGHFLCLHAHCQERSTGEYLDAIGYTLEGMEEIDDAEIHRAFNLSTGLGGTANSGGGTGAPVTDGPRFERDKNTGVIKWTLQNVITALKFPDWGGLAISWDRFADQILIREHGSAISRPLLDLDYTNFALSCHAHGFKKTEYPIQMIRAAFYKVANDHSFDSAEDWLNSLPEWDRVRRVDTFCDRYLRAGDNPYSRALSRYWWTAHAGRLLDPGCQADMAVVLISAQGTGKTSAVKAMVPDEDWFCELSFSEADPNLSRAMRGKAIGEIAEMRGWNGKEQEAIKAWVSRRRESWVPKYMEQGHTFDRRLILVGTSNNEEFLADETGHRRWLPIVLGDKQDIAGIERDREQLWAEAHRLWMENGIAWASAQELARAEHHKFEVRDPWEEKLSSWLREPDIGDERPEDRAYLTIYQILSEGLHIDVQHMKMSEKHRIGKVMRTLGYSKKLLRDNGHVIKGWVKDHPQICNPSTGLQPQGSGEG